MKNVHSKRYRIGEVSKITGLPISRLRYYDKIGILSPSWRDEDSDYRYYDAYQLEEAYLIEQYQYFGFSLSQIKLLLNNPKSYFDNSALVISDRLKELDEEIAKLEKIRKKLKLLEEYNLKQLQEFHYNDYEICPMPPQFFALSDVRIDIFYNSHFATVTDQRIEMYAVDRKLPWYYAEEFYQMPLKNAEINTVGRFCIRFETDEVYTSKLPLYREAAPFCIKYMSSIEISDIASHVEKMLTLASRAGYKPCWSYYYLGELVMEAPENRESAVRQIIIPLTNS